MLTIRLSGGIILAYTSFRVLKGEKMKKAIISALCLVILFMTGCGATTGAAATGNQQGTDIRNTDGPDVPKVIVINHKNKAFGLDQPAWLMDVLEDNYDSFKEKFNCHEDIIIKVQDNGPDLDLVQSWMENADFNAGVAATFHTAAMNKFSGVLSDREKTQKTITAVASKAEFSGFRKVADYWTLLRTIDNKSDKVTDEYHVIQIYSINKELYKKQINSLIDEIVNEFESGDRQQAENMADALVAELMKDGKVTRE